MAAELLSQLSGHQQRRMMLGGLSTTSNGTRTNIGLNSAFVNGTSGAAWAVPFMASRTTAIVACYCMLDATTGTRANVTMTGSLYNQGSSASKAGTTQRATVTGVTLPASDDKWIKFQFASSYTPAVGEILWFVVENTAAAPATDYPSIVTAWAGSSADQPENNSGMVGWTTTTGFSGASSSFTKRLFVIEYADGTVEGWPCSATTTTPFTSNQLERGIFIPAAPFPYQIGSIYTHAATTSLVAGAVYADGTAPGGTALGTWAYGTDTNETIDELMGVKILDTPIDVPANTAIRVVVDMSVNNATPSCFTIEGYSDYSAVFDAFFNAGSLVGYGTQDDGAGGWTDTKSIIPTIAVFLRGWPGSSGGGGSRCVVI